MPNGLPRRCSPTPNCSVWPWTVNWTATKPWLKNWLDQVYGLRPVTERQKLERDLSEAVTNEDYEKAAQVRDALRNLKEGPAV